MIGRAFVVGVVSTFAFQVTFDNETASAIPINRKKSGDTCFVRLRDDMKFLYKLSDFHQPQSKFNLLK